MIEQNKLVLAIKELNSDFAVVVNGKVIEFTTGDILDLIHRLQSENAEIKKWYDTQSELYNNLQEESQMQKAEIERLTIAEKQYLAEIERLNGNCGRYNIKLEEQIKETYDYIHKYDKLKKRNAELQKQVDELKEKIMNLKSAMTDRVLRKSYDSLLTMPEDIEEIFGDAYESEFNKFLGQSVKETAKEIFTDLLKEFSIRKSCGNADVVVREMAQRKGVEVE